HWAASLVAGLLAVAGLLVNVLYFAGFWSTAGQTPGMRVMHLRVAGPSGAPPCLGRSLVRLAGLALAILLLFTGFLPALVDDRRRALQDFLAGTLILASGDESAIRPEALELLAPVRAEHELAEAPAAH